MTNTKGEEKPSARPARPASNKPGSNALPDTEQNEKIQPPRDPPMLFDSPRISIANSETRQTQVRMPREQYRRHYTNTVVESLEGMAGKFARAFAAVDRLIDEAAVDTLEPLAMY